MKYYIKMGNKFWEEFPQDTGVCGYVTKHPVAFESEVSAKDKVKDILKNGKYFCSFEIVGVVSELLDYTNNVSIRWTDESSD